MFAGALTSRCRQRTVPARLYAEMAADAQSISLAMLDETGVVVSWYGSPEGRDYVAEEVVDRHTSLFYVSEEVSRRQPFRDLRTAVSMTISRDERGAAGAMEARFWALFAVGARRQSSGPPAPKSVAEEPSC